MSVRERTCYLTAAGMLVLLLAPHQAQAAKQKRQNPAQVRENAKEEAIDRLAEDVFKQADGNHNHVLSKSEQARAEELLQAGLMGLVEQGILGMPVQQKKGKNGKRPVQVEAPNGAAVFGPPPSSETKKGKGLPLDDFKAYVHTEAQKVDAEVAQNRASQMQQQGKGRRRPNAGLPPPAVQ